VAGIAGLLDRWIGAAAPVDPLAVNPQTGLRGAVVITGGSSGIGLEIARRFASDGYHVVLVARSHGELNAAVKRMRGERATYAVTAIAMDITARDAPEHLRARLIDQDAYCTILVNAAGVGLSGAFTQRSRDDIDRLIALNVRAATDLARAFLPDMLDRRHGGILNVASFGGLVPGPYQAVYYASKAYLLSLTEALAWETRRSGVRVSAVAPGPVETAFHAKAGAENALYRRLLPGISAKRVADAAVTGFWLGRTLVAPGVLYWVLIVLIRAVPRRALAAIMGVLLKPRASSCQDHS